MNLVGQRYGSLTILEEIPGKQGRPRMVKCQCDCGTLVLVRKYSLSSGKKIPSCGCHRLRRYDSMMGCRFGKLVVQELSSRQDRRGHIHRIARCLCDCGKTTMSYVASLLHRNTHSCGCDHDYGKVSGANSHFFTGSGDISGTLWCDIKQNAEKRKLEVTIDLPYVRDLFEKQNGRCALTNVQLVTCGPRSRITASLDRINNEQGYVPGNVQWVHKIANMARGANTVERFIRLCLLVASQQGWQPGTHCEIPDSL